MVKTLYSILHRSLDLTLVNPTFKLKGKEIQGEIFVKYLNNTTKVSNIFEFTLTLQKVKNWKIIDIG